MIDEDPSLPGRSLENGMLASARIPDLVVARVVELLRDALSASGSKDWTPEEFAAPHHVKKAAKLLDKELDGNTRACFDHFIPVEYLARRLLKYGADVTEAQVRRHL